jgi:hypothetical protein
MAGRPIPDATNRSSHMRCPLTLQWISPDWALNRVRKLAGNGSVEVFSNGLDRLGPYAPRRDASAERRRRGVATIFATELDETRRFQRAGGDTPYLFSPNASVRLGTTQHWQGRGSPNSKTGGRRSGSRYG